jgi:transcriptional antiterminator NusG
VLEHKPNGKSGVTDQPNNASDPPHDLLEHACEQRGVGQPDPGSGVAAEAATAAGPAPDTAAEVSPEQSPAETAAERVPAELEAEHAQPADAAGEPGGELPGEQPPGETVAEPIAPDVESEEAQPAEALSEPDEGLPGEPPPAEIAGEAVPAEVGAEQEEVPEAVGEAGAETPPEQPTTETAAEPAPAGVKTEQAQPAEAVSEAIAEIPPEQPVAETVAEPAPVEVETEEAQPAEAVGDAVAEAPTEETSVVAPAEAAEPAEGEPPSENMDWYILKVQSNREDSIREGLLRRVAIAGLGRYFGQVIVPTEKVTEFKGGKKRVTKRKLYPGYLVVQMEINDDTWFLVRETPGIGDFTGAAGHPTPMLPHEVSRILARQEEKSEKAPKLKIGFRPGDQVKINEGTFENFEGEVESIDQTNGQVTVMINIFGRSTPVTLEYWQIETV